MKGRMWWVDKSKKKKRGMTFIPYDYEAAFNKSINDLHEYFVEQMLKNRFKCVYALKEIRAGEQFRTHRHTHPPLLHLSLFARRKDGLIFETACVPTLQLRHLIF